MKHLIFFSITRNIILALTCTMLSSCISSKFSHKVNNDKVEIKMNEGQDVISFKNMRYQKIPTLADRNNAKGAFDWVVNPLLYGSLASDIIKKVIDMDKKRHTATY